MNKRILKKKFKVKVKIITNLYDRTKFFSKLVQKGIGIMGMDINQLTSLMRTANNLIAEFKEFKKMGIKGKEGRTFVSCNNTVIMHLENTVKAIEETIRIKTQAA